MVHPTNACISISRSIPSRSPVAIDSRAGIWSNSSQATSIFAILQFIPSKAMEQQRIFRIFMAWYFLKHWLVWIWKIPSWRAVSRLASVFLCLFSITMAWLWRILIAPTSILPWLPLSISASAGYPAAQNEPKIKYDKGTPNLRRGFWKRAEVHSLAAFKLP